jgi:DNA-directed RNA polymerase beta subunit
MPLHRFFLSDFVAIQRNSFLHFLEKGLIEEFSKRNPITNSSNTLEIFFYPEYYQLAMPKYSIREAIIKGKSYSSRLYMPVQLTDKKSRIIKFKWVYLGDLPIMTKRGHFIINGAARVIVNQIIRSPGIYYQTKIYENFEHPWSQKADSFYERHYADLICQRGTWLRLEIDKEKKIWAQTKRGPKMPIMWLLIAMGLTEKMIFKSVLDPQRLVYNMLAEEQEDQLKQPGSKTKLPEYIKTPPEAWAKIYTLFTKQKNSGVEKETQTSAARETNRLLLQPETSDLFSSQETNSWTLNGEAKQNDSSQQAAEQDSEVNPVFSKFDDLEKPKARSAKEDWISESESTSNETGNSTHKNAIDGNTGQQLSRSKQKKQDARSKKTDSKSHYFSDLGRQLIFNKFMNPRTYDLSKQGRLNFNKKLNLTVSSYQTTLTPQDLLAATDYLLKVEYGLRKVDDIDHLKNRRVRTSGELIQIQLGTGLVRLEKSIKEKMDLLTSKKHFPAPQGGLNRGEGYGLQATLVNQKLAEKQGNKTKNAASRSKTKKQTSSSHQKQTGATNSSLQQGLKSNQQTNLSKTLNLINNTQLNNLPRANPTKKVTVSINTLINTKPVNSALREFFGTSPLSQFMDQINPLAELTHKRRLSSMGPGGVTRDSATLDIRGIHASHYGRICPVETPEGKNTGLVNSLTTYARVNSQGYIETPFYKVYKGQVQQKTGMYFFSAEQEDKIKLGASDLSISDIGFLSTSNIPVRIEEEFSKISRDVVEYVGISPLQMVSIATSLIPFLEHDDANRALMGSNMQRQAVPILKPERPIVGTGLEARAVSDSGHALQSKTSGLITYVSADKLVIYYN